MFDLHASAFGFVQRERERLVCRVVEHCVVSRSL
jgi:hypothetical protein